jgi:hypothetical protein
MGSPVRGDVPSKITLPLIVAPGDVATCNPLMSAPATVTGTDADSRWSPGVLGVTFTSRR